MQVHEALHEVLLTISSLKKSQEDIPCSSVRAQIERTLGQIDGLLPPTEGRPGEEALKKLKVPVQLFMQTGKIGNLDDRKNLRRLCYFFDSPALISPTLLESSRSKMLLEKMSYRWIWRDAFLLPLLMVFFRNYGQDSSYSACYNELKNLLSVRFPEYNGKKPILLFVKNHMDMLLASDGPVRMASIAREQGLDFFSSAIELGIPENALRTAFFGLSLVAFVSQAESTDGLLDAHVLERIGRLVDADAQKAVVAAMVVKFGKDESLISVLTALSFSKIGDPMTFSYWKITGKAFEHYQPTLDKARQVVASWINRQVLDYFFEKADMDGGRKAFWRKYAAKISRIWVAMYRGYDIDPRLSGNQDLDSWLKQRLITIGKATNDIGLIMEFESWVIVEIGTPGNACYIYSRDNLILARIKNTLPDLGMLKCTWMKSLNEYDFRGEGRLIHTSEWQYKFRMVLSNGMGLKP